MRTLKDFSVSDQRILVRCDFNVPVDEKGNISDDFKIKQTLPTIKYLMEHRAKIVLMSHWDPKSAKVAGADFKLDKIGEKLTDYLKVPILKADDCIGPEVEEQSSELKPGQILLLENLRFHKEETDNDLEFAKKLSYLGDIYVNDAFAESHRDYASMTGVPQFIPHCAGLLLEKEIENLDKILKSPERPMVALVGGKKVDTKSKFIDNISEVADFVLINGLIKKEVMEEKIEFKHPEKIISPEENLDAFDIDEKDVEMFSQKIMQAKTVLWNGPFGKFEEKKYASGTLALAEAIIESGAFSVVGGGETVEFLEKQGILEKFSHVSTGGGAMLSYLAGEDLPGISVLK